MTARLTVLAWHNVRSSWCFPFPSDGRRGFARQLAVLARLANVVPLEAALRDLADGRPLPPRAVALTFDDGYADHLDDAVPALRHHQLPATFFLVTGLLDKSVRPWWEVTGWAFARATVPRLDWEGASHDLRDAAARRAAFDAVAERLKRRDDVARHAAVDELVAALEPTGGPGDEAMFLDWDGARRLVQAGFSIGSHTTSHAILSEETPDAQRRDLAESRHLLQQRLDVDAAVLAYPNGTVRDYGAATVTAAAAAGYDRALTTIEGRNRPDTPPFEVRRHVLTPMTGTRPLASLLRRIGRLVRARR